MDEPKQSHSATDLLVFFSEAQGDGLNITWAHAVNSKAELDQALKGDVMMLETDITVRGWGTTKQTNILVHAHPPATDGDITFEEWIDKTIQVPNKGIKLDFKCNEAVELTLQAISQRKVHVPVLLNADIAVGPNSCQDPLEADKFIKTCNLNLSEATMSLGFTTFWEPGSKATLATYTWEMIFDLLQKVHELSQAVTFPIRAAFLASSWERFVWLLGVKKSYSITVWSHATDDVDMQGMLALRKHGGKDRVFFDLPGQQMAEFQRVLSIADDAFVPRKTSWNLDFWYIDQSAPSPGSLICLSTNGVGFLTTGSIINIVSRNVRSKQILDVTETETNPFEVSGKVQFIVNSSEADGDTLLRVSISCSDPQAVESRNTTSSSNSSTTNDLLSISISSCGTVCLQNLTTQIPVDTCYMFTIYNIGSGHTPTVKVASGQSDRSADELLGSISLPDDLVVTSAVKNFCVSFCRVGTSKDLLVENFAVKL